MAVIHYVAVLLGLFFIFAGTIKVVPINPGGQGYDFMMKEFERFATVSPLKLVGVDLSPHLYCALVGLVEVMCGTLIAFGRNPYRFLSCLDIIIIMIGALYTLFALGEPLPQMIPAIVCGTVALMIVIFRDGLDGRPSKKSGSSSKSKQT